MESSVNAVNLTDIIAPAFYAVHWDILDGNHTYYDLYGGRGSTKSSFVGVEIPLGIIRTKCINSPCNLLKHRFSQGISNFSEYHSICMLSFFRVHHHPERNFNPYKCCDIPKSWKYPARIGV